MSLDDLDFLLVEALRRDGRASSRSLGAELGVNEVTVANRIRRLAGESIIRVVAVTDMEAFGHAHLAFAKIRVAGTPALKVAGRLAGIQELMTVSIVTGGVDIIATVLARDRDHLTELVGGEIAAVAGVESVAWELALRVVRFDSDWGALDDNTPSEPWFTTDRVDELDLQIIHELQADARASNRAIATRIDVSEGAVRTRIRRMEQEKLIRIQAISDIGAFGIEAYAYVGIEVEGGASDRVADALAELGPIAAIMRTLGEFDIFMLVAAHSRAELVELLLGRIGELPGVRRTQTFEACATLKHSYAWARLV